MKIQINGQDKEVSAATVAELVEQLGLKGDRVAIELNRDIVPRAKWGGDARFTKVTSWRWCTLWAAVACTEVS